ncbi:hypothetical protein OIO90_005706 [Microbotryomycetes sp. JL221]|nr:hypothetical protein OIO90_005706 [Microbotryomycetes sp. JL221]
MHSFTWQLLLLVALIRRPALAQSTTPSSNVTEQGQRAVLTAVCTPSECITGIHRLAAGVKVAYTLNTTRHELTLLPGTYTPSRLASNLDARINVNGTTNETTTALGLPTSAQAFTVTPATGFSSSGSLSSTSFSVSFEPGVLAYESSSYSNSRTNFESLSRTNPNVTRDDNLRMQARSMLLSDNTFVLVKGKHDRQIALWDSVADVDTLGLDPSQIELTNGEIDIVGLQSSSCREGCASGGICGSVGKCLCLPGFTGARCDECTLGYYGAKCEPCQEDCTKCDSGITGTGRCLDLAPSASVTLPSALPSKCTAGAIDNFGPGSMRADIRCSECIPGSYLVDGACRDTCPEGFSPSPDQSTCIPTNCLSCDNESTLSNGACIPTDDGCDIVPGFGVCLATLVTASVTPHESLIDEVQQRKLPWWTILIIIVILLVLGLATTFCCLKRKFKKRRAKKTAIFADSLDKKQVAFNLEQMASNAQTSEQPAHAVVSIDVPSYDDLVHRPAHLKLNDSNYLHVDQPKFVISNSPTESESTRWSRSSLGSMSRSDISGRRDLRQKHHNHALQAQTTGSTNVSGTSSRIQWSSNNPFINRTT